MSHRHSARVRPIGQSATDAAYDRWAPIYDLLFDMPFRPGRSAAARAASEAAGARGEILVVGVGTGLELGLLPKTTRVTGIDVSVPMLNVARERVAREALGQVKSLLTMDAGALTFGDARFDVTLAPYVLSVVPDPARALNEMWRVTRPGGEIVVMNHFAAIGGPRARVEAMMEGASGWLGWRPQFPYSAFGDWLAAKPEARLIERRELAPLSLFTLLRIKRS